jgi:hypothetical protein
MRSGYSLRDAAYLVFAIYHAGWSSIFFGCYVAAYFLAAESGETFISFLEAQGFVGFFLVSFIVSAFIATAFAAIGWVANGKVRRSGIGSSGLSMRGS